MDKCMQHMIKYKYIPLDFGKPKHKGKQVHYTLLDTVVKVEHGTSPTLL